MEPVEEEYEEGEDHDEAWDDVSDEDSCGK
jgi:hypothetical protein